MGKICRVCLQSSSGRMVNIFTRKPDAETLVSEMIARCTGCEIKRGDNLPDSICSPCLRSAQDAFETIKTLERSNKFYCQARDVGFEEALCEWLEEEDWDIPDSNPGSDWAHSEGASIASEAKAPGETAEISSPDQVENLRISHDEAASEPIKSDTENAPLMTRRRRNSRTEGPYRCAECSRFYKSKTSLSLHIRMHTGDRPFKCKICSKTFKLKGTYDIHLRTHSGERPYKCSHCSKSFTQLCVLVSHKRIHTGERPYTCSKCPKSFVKISDLHRHVRTHDGIRPHKCTHCSKSFARNSHLRGHLLRMHLKELPPIDCPDSDQGPTHKCAKRKSMKCPECPKTFHITSHLNEHIRIHTGAKPFKCTHCPKSFTQSSTLKSHLRLHTGEKPFKCSACSETFNSQSTLSKHRKRSHTKEKSPKAKGRSKA
ncbi:hypothetical protein KR018_006059 [Drosophila ironensis]|nr:hypothetical protein KR018_006059 [Drosophila ironensis]